MRKPGPGSGLAEGTRYLALGMRFGLGIVLFVVVGLALDRWLGVTPLFTLAGTILGAVLSFVSVYREIAADPDNQPSRRWWPRRPR